MENRSYDDFLKKLTELTKSYVPSWRFDLENPDFGTALAVAFGRMQYDTEKKSDELLEKWKTGFFNALHTSLRGSSPAMGYVNFSLVNDEVEGTALPVKSRLITGKVKENGEAIPVETKDDLYVNPSTLMGVYESWDKKDFISCLWEKDEEIEDQKQEFVLFGYDKENLQEHEIYIGCKNILDSSFACTVEITFRKSENSFLEESETRNILENCSFSYLSKDGFVPFKSQEVRGGKIVFLKGAKQPVWEAQEFNETEDCCWIRCHVVNGLALAKLSLYDIKIRTSASMIKPDSIYADNIDVNTKEFLPFGEQPSIYDEVYFTSDEILGKTGSEIELSFLRHYMEVPVGMQEPKEINWKLVMSRDDVKVEPTYDITIAKIIWEYYNGNGWVSLFPEHRYSDIFSPEEGSYKKKYILKFTCPEDLSFAEVNGEEKRAVRARVLKMNNAFKTQGQYISPIISDVYFSFDYKDEGKEADLIREKNNCRDITVNASSYFGNLSGNNPVKLAGDERGSVYLKFSNPLSKGPVRLLFVLDSISQKRPDLNWQYFGNGSWQELNPADGTKNLRRTGLLSFSGLPDMQELEMFGQKGFWIRARDINGEYGDMSHNVLPTIKGIYLNSVRVWTVKSGQEETFTAENYESQTEFQLFDYPVSDVKVYVNETGLLSSGERKALEEEGRFNIVQEDEELQQMVLWKEVESFDEKLSDGRGYMLDASTGTIKFSSETGYKMPPPGISGGIKVMFSTGGGSDSNLDAHDVTGLELSEGFISKVDNPLALAGAFDEETVFEAIKRKEAQIKHGFRAVTAGDYENLAKEASGIIEKVKCFTGLNADGKEAKGNITLVVLQRDYEKSAQFFPELENRISSYLADKVPSGMVEKGKLHIVMPDFVNIQVNIDVCVENFNDIFKCENEILKKLNSFLDPVTGNIRGQGFNIGELPGWKQIDMLLKDVREIKRINNLVVVGSITKGGQIKEVELDMKNTLPYALPVSGNHRIVVKTV